MAKPTLLMTRPPAASERFVAALPAALRAGLAVHHSPLLRIVPLTQRVEFADARGVVFTSENGVATASGLTERRDLPVYCVGAWTTQKAREAGWRAVMLGENAAEMIAAMQADPPEGPLLHLRGRHGSADIAGALAPGGCELRVQVIYEQELLELDSRAQALLAGPGVVIAPLFSPRTAQQFARSAPARGASAGALRLAAISEAAARPLRAMRPEQLVIATRPTAGALADSVGQLAGVAQIP